MESSNQEFQQATGELLSSFAPGQILGGKYKIIDTLGAGGMGLVFRVQQVFIAKEYALKTLKRTTVNDTSIRRFQLEAKATAVLNHPNLVQVHDFGLLDDGAPYFVMDFVDGVNLSEHLKKSGLLGIEETLAIIVQLAEGLGYAHRLGVVHRDIKTSNIMLVKGVAIGAPGCAKILDFGIAKMLTVSGDTEFQSLTRAGEVFGSPSYMSPEQCSGAPVDHRTDIYSLGCVLFECLTGAPPHLGASALTTLMLHQTEAASSLREASLGKEFPEGLERIVAKMLAKSPDDRYDDLSMVAADLRSFIQNPFKNVSIPDGKVDEKNARTISIVRKELYSLLSITAVSATALGGFGGFIAKQVQFMDGRPAMKSTHTHNDPPIKDLPISVTDIAAADAPIDNHFRQMLENKNQNHFAGLLVKSRAALVSPASSPKQLEEAFSDLGTCLKILDEQKDLDQGYRIRVKAMQGWYWLRCNQLEKAETLANDVSKLQSNNKSNFEEGAGLCLILGLQYQEQKKLDKALMYLTKAIDLSTKAKGTSRCYEVAACQTAMGRIYASDRKEIDEGIHFLKLAKRNYESSNSTKTDQYAGNLVSLSHALREAQRHQEAANSYKLAIAKVRPLTDTKVVPPTYLIECYDGLGCVQIALGDFSAAKKSLKNALTCCKKYEFSGKAAYAKMVSIHLALLEQQTAVEGKGD